MTNPTQPIPQPFPQQPPVKQKKPVVKRVWFWVLVVLVLMVVAGACSGGGDTAGTSGTSGTTSTVQQPATAENTPAEQTPAEEAPAEQPNVTREQRNALRSAENYLDFGGFSEQGLRKQLEFESFPPDAIDYALANVTADWNAEALQSAENYDSFAGMSDQGLYDQLIFEGFTPEQAQYAIDNLQ